MSSINNNFGMVDSQFSLGVANSGAPPASQAAPQAAMSNPIPVLNPALQGVDNPDIDEGIYELATGGRTRDNSESDSDFDTVDFDVDPHAGIDLDLDLDLGSECESDTEMVVMTRKDVKRLKFLENYHEEVSSYHDTSQRQLNEVGARLAMEKTDKELVQEKLKVARKEIKDKDNRIAQLEAQLMVMLASDVHVQVQELPSSPLGGFDQDGEDHLRYGD